MTLSTELTALVHGYAKQITADRIAEIREGRREEIDSLSGKLWSSLYSAKERKVYHTLISDVKEAERIAFKLTKCCSDFNDCTPTSLLKEELLRRVAVDLHQSIDDVIDSHSS